MNVKFYAPELCDLVDEMDKKHTIIAKAMAQFLLDNKQTAENKGNKAGEAAIAAAELQKITELAINKLALLASSKVHA